jgi:hypothetical protein
LWRAARQEAGGVLTEGERVLVLAWPPASEGDPGTFLEFLEAEQQAGRLPPGWL